MRTIVVEIPVNRIKQSRRNPRHSAEELEELAQSIRSVGVLQPLLVCKLANDPEHFGLVAGKRRFAASKLAGKMTVPCLVLPAMGERQERAVSLIENLHRKDLSPIELGEAARDLCATGMTQHQVATMIGVSQTKVSKAMAMLHLPEYARRLIDDGTIGSVAGYELTHLDEAKVATAVKALTSEKAQTATDRRPSTGGRRAGYVGGAGRTDRDPPDELERTLMYAKSTYRKQHYGTALTYAMKAVRLLEALCADEDDLEVPA